MVGLFRNSAWNLSFSCEEQQSHFLKVSFVTFSLALHKYFSIFVFFTTLFNVHLPSIFLETCFSFSLCILNLFALRVPYIFWILFLYMRVNWQAFPLDMCFPFSSVCVYTFTNCTMMSKYFWLFIFGGWTVFFMWYWKSNANLILRCNLFLFSLNIS